MNIASSIRATATVATVWLQLAPELSSGLNYGFSDNLPFKRVVPGNSELQDLQTAVGLIFLLSLYMLNATAPAPQNI
jgi:hypothetical protein